MTSLSQNTPSNIASLESSQAACLRKIAARIRNLSRKTSDAILEIGRELLKVKAETAHGTFTQWVENDCGLTRRSAQNYMRVATFAADKSASVALLSPGVLYRLAAKSTPAEIVSAVLRLLDGGSVPTESEVAELFAATPTSAAAFAEPEMDNSFLLAAALLSSVGAARAQELLNSWRLVGRHLGIMVEEQSIDPDPMMRSTSCQALDPGFNLVRVPNNEDCFSVQADAGNREWVAPPDHPADVACHPNQPILEHAAPADEPGPTAAAEGNADAGQPDFTTDSEGPLHGIPDFLRYTNRR